MSLPNLLHIHLPSIASKMTFTFLLTSKVTNTTDLCNKTFQNFKTYFAIYEEEIKRDSRFDSKNISET